MLAAEGQNLKLDVFFFLPPSVLTLETRQKRAEELRRLTDRSASMSEEQLSELRAEIKVIEPNSSCSIMQIQYVHVPVPVKDSPPPPPQHFVSERKYDEDLGKAVRFTFELEPLKTSITSFGSGRPPRLRPLGSHDL